MNPYEFLVLPSTELKVNTLPTKMYDVKYGAVPFQSQQLNGKNVITIKPEKHWIHAAHVDTAGEVSLERAIDRLYNNEHNYTRVF